MINRAVNKELTTSFIPKFSDADLLRTVIRSSIWKSLFLNRRDAIWELMKGLYYFKTELFIIPVRSLLRFQFGQRTMGFFMVTMSMIMMIGFNSKTIWGVLFNLFPFMAPLWVVMIEEQNYLFLIFSDIQSVPFLYFWLGSTISSFCHLITFWIKPEYKEEEMKRGNSVLYFLLFGRFGVSESWVQIVIEPSLTIILGVVLMYNQIDVTLGLFLCISGFCLLIQELQDAILNSAMK